MDIYSTAAEKPITWLGSSLVDLRAFPDAARQAIGYQLSRVQLGEMPQNWKPMPSVGPGVQEIRVRVGGAFRALYVSRYADAVYVLHVFEKKSRKTALTDIALARQRLASIGRGS